MLDKLSSSFFDIIEASLDPFEPISLLETRRHDYPFVLHATLEPFHAVPLILSDIVPAKVNAPIVLRLDISGDDILAIGDIVVESWWWNIHGIFAIVPGIVWIVGVWLIDRLFQFFKVLLICPFFIPVAVLVVRAARYAKKLRVRVW